MVRARLQLSRKPLGSAKKILRSQSLSRVELEVYFSNHPAIRLYERFGFTREGVRRSARILDVRSGQPPAAGSLAPRAGGLRSVLRWLARGRS